MLGSWCAYTSDVRLGCAGVLGRRSEFRIHVYLVFGGCVHVVTVCSQGTEIVMCINNLK